MKSEEVDALARKREQLPETAGLCDMWLYHILTALYGEYREGIISRDVAKVEKARAMEQHRSLETWERIFREQAKRENEIGGLLVRANRGECVCQEWAKIYDGRIR